MTTIHAPVPDPPDADRALDDLGRPRPQRVDLARGSAVALYAGDIERFLPYWTADARYAVDFGIRATAFANELADSLAP